MTHPLLTVFIKRKDMTSLELQDFGCLEETARVLRGVIVGSSLERTVSKDDSSEEITHDRVLRARS